MSNEIQKETAIQNEQQLKSNNDIVNDIINVLLENTDMSFTRGRYILLEAIDVLGTTPIMRK